LGDKPPRLVTGWMVFGFTAGVVLLLIWLMSVN
jgi:hypothetical protein